MLFLENLKPLKIYRRPLFLPTVEGDKKKKSAIFLLTPNYESSKQLITSNLLINRLRFASYYIEKDLTFFIGKKAMKDTENVSETYIHNMTQYDMYQSLCEMSAAERNSLKDSQFGLPDLRKYPLDTIDHVKSAIKFFNYVDSENEEELARNINKAIKKFKMTVNVGKKNRFSKYITGVVTESIVSNKVNRSVKLFHGSPVQNLKYIEPHNEAINSKVGGNSVVYATDDIRFAACFGGNWRDFSARQGTWDGWKTITFGVSDSLDLDKPCSIYELENDGSFIRIATKEVVSYNKIKVKKEIKYNSFREMLKSNGVEVITIDEYLKRLDKSKKSINESSIITESWIFNKNNVEYNLEKFKSGKSNILLITGLSGSGKSTLGEKYAKEYKAELIELDIFEHCYGYNDDNLKEAGEVFYEYLSHNKDIWDRLKKKEIRGKELGEEINKFVHYCINWCKKHKNTKWVIEGVQIYSFMKSDEVKNSPMIILGTSAKNSILQRFKRNAGGGKIQWREELTNEFPQLLRWYWDEEKSLTSFKKSLVETVNDKGETVPKVCPECGGKIVVKIQGEPVYLCSDCNKYFGTVVCKESSNDDNNLSSFKIINNPNKKFIEDHMDDADCIKDFLSDAVRKNSCFFLDTKTNKVACVFMIFNDRGHKIINNFEIAPDYRGKGLSKQLLDFAVKKKGANHLWVNDDNTIAKNLYLKYGFEFTGDKVKDNGNTRLYMALNKSVNESSTITRHILDLHTNGTDEVTLDGNIVDINDSDEYCPVKLANIPNYMGINLCSVQSVEWSTLPNGQLIDIVVKFIPDIIDGKIEECSILEAVLNDPYTNPILEKEWGFTHVDGLYNSLVRVQGIYKNLRGRAEMLVLDSTMTKVYLVFDKDGKDYKIPGGGFDCDETHKQSAERETREEARISTVGVYDTGVRYVKMYDDDPAVRQKEFAEENRFYGAYTEIFIGIAVGTTYDEELNTLDVDNKMTKGKFYNISEVYDKLKDVHKRALGEIVDESTDIISKSTNKKLYFISDKDIDGTILKPRVPKNFLTDNGYEDNETNRVCFAPTINQCLMGMSSNLKDKSFYVYIPDGDYELYKPTKQEVPDVNITGETWIKEPVKIKKIGSIKVIKDSGKPGHKYTYGEGKIAELYDWDYKWTDKAVNEEAANLSNLPAYHLELARKGFNPKIAGGWDEELYSKSIDSAIKNDVLSKYELKDIKEELASGNIDKKAVEAYVYTVSEEWNSWYIGKLTIYLYSDDKFDWEWAEQEDIQQSLIDYYKEEVWKNYITESAGDSPENAILSVSALIMNNGKFLLENHKKAKAYTIPGGKVNEGEQPVEALVRELGEELGIKPTEIEIFIKNTFKCGYPAGSGNYVWFTDYCFIVHEYTGEIQNLEYEKHSELVWKSFDEMEGMELSALLRKVKSYHDHQCKIMSITDNIDLNDKVTCSGYMEDLKILKYIATPELYKDLLDILELTEDDFENGIPRLNFIGGDKEDLVIDNINGETNINICCYSMSKDRLSISQYIKTSIEIAIIGIIVTKCPNLSGTIFPMAIAECILGFSGHLAEFASKLIAKYTMRGLIEKLTGLDYTELFKDAKEMGISQIKDIDDLKTTVTESSTIPTTVANLSNKLKYKNTKVKIRNGKLRNTISRLSDSIKDSIKVDMPSTSTSSSEDKEITEAVLLSSLVEGSYIINGDYITILTEDAANDPALRRILYKERIIKRADILLLLDRVKSDIPEIKYAYPDLDRYNGKNLFIDLYYYNESFFKNNEYNVIKSYSLYRDMINRLINDKRITSVYERRTVFIPINDWRINPSTRMWFYKDDLNPISMIYEMMYKDPNGLKKLFKGVTFVFFDKDKYFTIDIDDVANAKRNSIKFKSFITKINKNEEFDSADEDSVSEVPSREAIKTDIMDKIETSKGVDLTQASVSLEKEKKNASKIEKGSPVKNNDHNNRVNEVPAEKKSDKPKEIDFSKSKASQNKSVATDTGIEDEEKLKDIVNGIDKAVANAIDVDDALDKMDDDINLKDLISNLDTMRDDVVDISPARAERMQQLDKELLDKNLKGQSIRDILGDNTNPDNETNTEIPSTSLPIGSPNEEWNNMKYINFSKTYNLEADLVKIFKFFDKVSRPLSIRDIKAEDNSTSEDRLDLYTVEYEDYRGKRFTIKLDIPKVKNNRFLLRGNDKNIQTQFFNMPIIKTDLDTCQIVTNYKKIIISRYNASSGKSLPNVARFMKAMNKYEGRKIKVITGDNTRVCAKYILPIDYIDLSSVYKEIETDEYIFFFDQDDLRKKYEVNDSYGVPFGYDKKNKSIVYYPNNETTPFINILMDLMITDQTKYKDFLELYNSAKAPSRMMYTRARIMASDIPLVIVCAYSEGLSKVLKKANIEYRLAEKLNSLEKNSLDYDYIKFNDGYLYYKVDYCSSLLLNGLKDVDTLSHSFTEIDDKNMYLEFLDGYGGRIKADGLDNFYDCEIDPITEETLKYYKLPTDYIAVLLYANYLLSDNKFVRHTDTSSRRARRFELIAAYTYQVLTEAYGTYANSLKHNRNATTFSCKQSAVIDKILLDPTSSDYSVINLLNDIESTNAITTKGLSGMNSDRSYSLDKRTYDESMVGIVGMSTGFSANVGITRQATLDMGIEGKRGYVKSNKGYVDKMNAANTLTATEAVVPFAVTHDDPIRVAMTFIQTSKHAVRTAESDPLLVTNGSDEALPYICSDQFAFKSKQNGTIVELNDDYMIIEYKNGEKEYINLETTIEKNSDGGFYTTLKLDADPKLKIGSRVKEGQIVAWDKDSMSNSVGEEDNLAYNVGKLAKIAIINIEEGFEDSGICTEEIATKLACKITNKIECILDKHTNIFNAAKIGQAVEQGDTLLVWQTPYDEEEVNNLLKALANDEEAVSELGRHTLKSEYTGKVVGMKVYRTVNDDELSDSLKSLVRKYERPISELKKKLKEEGIENTDLPANYPLPATGKLKNAGDGVLIEFYVEYLDTLGVGDKITYNAANKAVIKNIIPKGKEPYTDFRPNEHISAFVSVTSIDKRMVCSTITYGALQKLMVELDRSCKDIAGIPYDDTQA